MITTKKILFFFSFMFCWAFFSDISAQNVCPHFLIDKDYLSIPLAVDEESDESIISVSVDGVNLFVEPMHFSKTGEQWWSNLDVSQFKGQTLILHDVPDYAASRILLSDTVIGYPNLYKEANRPQIHYSFRHGVLGDPTAKFYYAPKDEWHMFFIYNPFRGKEVSWGHAVSKDLIHWEEKPPVFAFSRLLWNGVGFVDTKNHLGLNKDGHQAIVLLQTHSGNITYNISIDGGETFNPVGRLKKEFGRADFPNDLFGIIRGWYDAPRIYWSDECQRYVLYVKVKKGLIHQYFSKDLKSWIQVEDVPPIPESFTFEGDPGEMVEMSLDGDPNSKYTVVMYGLHGYIVGHYREEGMLNLDGKPISEDDIILTTHFGYPTIFHNSKDGRIIMNQNLGNNGRGGIPNYELDYRPDASFPVELTLRSTPQGPRLFFNPVAEIETLYGKTHRFDTRVVDNDQFLLEGLKGRAFRITATFEPGDAKQFGFLICGSKVIYDTEYNMIAVDMDPADAKPHRKRRPLIYKTDSITLDILVDVTSLEVFANNGEVHIPHGRQNYYQKKEGDIKVFSIDGKVKVNSLVVNELDSMWP